MVADQLGTVRARRFRRVTLVAAQGAAIGVAAVFLVIGAAGFAPGLTTHVDALQWFGRHSGSEAPHLFGLFAVSAAHNLLHLGFGVAGLGMARTFAGSRTYLIGGGVFYLGLWLYGILADGSREVSGFNGADNWLHFGIGVTMTILGLTLAGSRVPTGADGEVLVPE